MTCFAMHPQSTSRWQSISTSVTVTFNVTVLVVWSLVQAVLCQYAGERENVDCFTCQAG